MKGTFGTILNEEMKVLKEIKIWLSNEEDAEGGGGKDKGGRGQGRNGKWNDVRVTFGEEEEGAGELLTEYSFYKAVPVELWVSGDLKWLAAAYGKENSSGHWCPWCLKSSKQWSEPNANIGEGPFWTQQLLSEYAEGVRSGRLKTSSERRGVVCEAVIDYVGPEKIVFPILHCMLGFGNDWLKSFIKEMQSSSEAYTDAYIKAEEALGKAVNDLDFAVQRLREYKAQIRDFVKESKKALRRRGGNAIGAVQAQILKNDLEKIDGDVNRLQGVVDLCKEGREAAREAFEKEVADEANGKAYGQPVRKGIEEILRNYGIDKGAAFGGDLQGNAVRKLMGKASTIIEEVKKFMLLQETLESRQIGTAEQIVERCNMYGRLLTAFDACISGLRTKRFHVTDLIVEQTEAYVKQVMRLCRLLGFNITPKLHCLECHAVHFLRKHRGFSDLAEDAGERAHQLEARKDLRFAAQRSHSRREAAKAAIEAKESDPRVQRKVRQMYENTRLVVGAAKRKAAIEACREEKKKIKLTRREDVLEFQVPEGRVKKFFFRTKTGKVQGRR